MNCRWLPLRQLHWFTLAVFGLVIAARGAGAAELQYPLSIAAGPDNALYLADLNLPGVWKINDGKLQLFFEGSKKFRTPLNRVRCVAVDAKGRLLAGDSSTREVYRFEEGNTPKPLTKGGIGIPMSIAFDSKGNIFVADLEIHRIMKVPEEGGEPVEFLAVPAPRGLAMDQDDRLWVVSHGKDQLLRISPDAKLETIVSGRPFQFPHTVVLDAELNAYVCDGYAKAVWKVDAAGKPVKFVEGPPLMNPVGLAWQGDRLLIADPHAKQVFTVSKDGKLEPLAMEPASK